MAFTLGVSDTNFDISPASRCGSCQVLSRHFLLIQTLCRPSFHHTGSFGRHEYWQELPTSPTTSLRSARLCLLRIQRHVRPSGSRAPTSLRSLMHIFHQGHPAKHPSFRTAAATKPHKALKPATPQPYDKSKTSRCNSYKV